MRKVYENLTDLSLRITFLTLLILCLSSFFNFSVNAEDNNLVENQGFEEAIDKNWVKIQWDATEGYSLVIQDYSESNSGDSSVKLTNIEENDLRVMQEIVVKSEQIYRISAFVKTDNIKEGGYGGALSVWETFIGTESIITNNEWKYIEFYGKTGVDQDILKLTLGLGGYGNTTIGDVWFDDVSVEAIISVPSGIIVQNLSKVEDASVQLNEPNAEVKRQYIYVYAFLYLSVLFGLYFAFRNKVINVEDLNSASFLIGILSFITLIKLFIAPLTQGFENDIALFGSWGLRGANDFTGLYESEGFIDYPPLYMYILAVIGKINQVFNIQYDSYSYNFLLKLPSIIADALTGFVLFKIAQKAKISHLGFLAAIVYVLNPFVLLDATIWGQVDSLFVLIILIGLYFMWQDKMVFSSIAFVMAVLLKPQGIIFLPILFFELVRRKDIKLFAECLFKGVLAGVLVILPFVFKSGPLFIIKLYMGTIDGYTYATFNAFNLFGLLGGNYIPDGDTLFILSYGAWGLIGIIAVTSFVMWLFITKYSKITPILGSLILCSGVFIFSARMHERYMFPTLALLLACYLLNNNKKYLLIFIGFTITNLINVQLVLYHHYFIEDMYINPNSLVIKVVALVNILLFIWLVQITLSDNLKEHLSIDNLMKIKNRKNIRKTHKPTKALNISYKDSLKNHTVNKKDFIIMTVMTLIYLGLTLYQLGDTESPQTKWSIPQVGESFVVEFKEEETLGHISFYTGVANGYDNRGAMTVEALDSNNTFIPVGELLEDSTFKWTVFPLDLKTKKIRFTSTLEGGFIHELGFYNMNGDKLNQFVVPVRSAGVGETNYLFDEQEQMRIYPDNMNSTYFDEIYFARTAYEIDEGFYVYESTHPTFGKLMILIGMKIFGNNPFGWRIMGALMGVLLIPIMYIFGKRLFKNSLLAFSAAFLMMFDFMHFTHSRFASIDIFTVVCVLLMYYFMYRYFVMDTYKAKRSESLKFLVLSGIFMALGISTKWNVVYGVIGLAITFFASRYFVYYYYEGKGMFVSKQVSLKHPFIKKEFVQTFLYCIPIFIIIPLVIYGLLHVPVIEAGRGSGISQIIAYQKGMYDYHSTSSATHPFSSKWYEWPLMIKPLWLYAYSYAQEGMKSSIASFGNPAIWWSGIVAFFVAGAIMIRKKDRKFAVVFVAYLLQTLPWVLVERTTYIYHYFTAIPFNIFMIVYVLAYLIRKNKNYKYLLYVYLFIVFILFVLFYPVLSGTQVSASYIDKLLLLKSWYF